MEQIVDGPLVWAPVLDGAVFLSTRGGDFELTVGQDLSIGYASYERSRVELYLTESFTFRVLEPAAADPSDSRLSGALRGMCGVLALSPARGAVRPDPSRSPSYIDPLVEVCPSAGVEPAWVRRRDRRR
ncbi:MAG: family 1 encapsulin nanocompartment shell protein [Polyangiaceae bacterium]